MRTTLTLDDDLAMLLHQSASATGRSFKEVVNDAIRKGLDDRPAAPAAHLPAPHKMGKPLIDLTQALSLADELDDIAARRVHGATGGAGQ